MTGHPGQDSSGKSGRGQRLAEALRANLKRRKAQERKRADALGEDAGHTSDNESAKEPG